MTMNKDTKSYNLKSIGFSKYYITDDGKIFENPSHEIIKDKNRKFYLTDDKGIKKRISQKSIYKKFFKKEFCIDNIQDLPGEQWKEINGTQGKYFVSNRGRIKSYIKYNAIILKPYIKNNGYGVIKINNKNIYIHFLVAKYFCQNNYKGQKIHIHHKTKNKTDNNSENLEILTPQEHRQKHQKEKKK